MAALAVSSTIVDVSPFSTNGTDPAPARDDQFFPHGDDWRGLRPRQTRLQGGDASSDSYCYR